MSEEQSLTGELRGNVEFRRGRYSFRLSGKLNIAGIDREVEMLGECGGEEAYEGEFTIIQPDGEIKATFEGNIFAGGGRGFFRVESATGIFESINKTGTLMYMSNSTGRAYHWRLRLS